MRRTASIVALAVALIACSAATPSGGPGSSNYGEGAKPTTPAQKSRAAREAKERARASDQPNPIPGHTGAPRYTGDPGEVPASYNDRGPVGGSAAAFLRPTPARRMIVEIDYVTDRRPSRSALDHLETILERDLSKPGGISIRVDDEITDVRSEWSFPDIRALESRVRDNRSGGDLVTMWIVFLSGELKGEEGALGVAYQSTSSAIFPDRVRSAATSLVQPASIERAVLTHEVGHLLGLVNLTIESKYDHEDPDHPGHSKYKASVMYWAIEDTAITSLITGGPPSDFDQYDRADLAAIRRG